jgi:predicted amidohydrolase
MKIAVSQMPDVRGDVARATELIRTFTMEAACQGADLVCFPEGFVQGYDLDPTHVARVAIEADSPAFDDVWNHLAALDPVVVFGWIEREGDRFYNAAVAIEHGQILARYRKICLLPPERTVFGAGWDCPVFEVRGIRVALLICHDLAHAATVDQAAAAGADVLVCPCNNMLPQVLAEQWKDRHQSIRAQRAKEHDLWIVTSDVTGERDGCVAHGPSAIIDPRGFVVAQVPLREEGVVLAEIKA